MKGLKFIFTLALAMLILPGAIADSDTDAARVAVRRGASSTTTQNRQKQPVSSTQKTQNSSARTNNVQSRTNGARTQTNTKSRTTTAVKPRTNSATPKKTVSERTNTVTARTTSTRQSSATKSSTARTATPIRTILTNTRAARSATRARAADATTTRTRDDILSRNYSKCKEVYYSCMDEFCANKDTQLKRCACSSRANEFDSTKKQLERVEDKMLSFNQRLLAVSMDPGDVVAMNNSTEGEDAYNSTKDKTDSKKQLDAIAKRLNTSFDDNNFGTGLSALSWSLNEEAAFDNIDSLSGAANTAKSGVALYRAATPVCLEMAREVCADDELSIAESGYQMAIEQDCNTVHKAYQTQTDQAKQKVLEGNALLDISRLDTYQDKNSDDILTCKTKMLEMLSDSTVCGDNLGKCLDVSGRYIDPTTGTAFLTENLANLDKLITRPSGNQTWLKAPGNATFVSFLNSKKKFLEPATKNCQDIADYVWNAFLEDALAQIKLAQGKKLEEMRQSCTTLTAECLDSATKSIEDFDARALTTFGANADLTVNAMCNSVRKACDALLNDTDADKTWASGMTQIANDKTYQTIMYACREIGRACVIQACTSTSGNFGLCMDAENSTNRKAIIDRTACWPEVLNCVASSGTIKPKDIMEQLGLHPYPTDSGTTLPYSAKTFYDTLYGQNGWYSGTDNDVNHDNYSTDCDNYTCIYDMSAIDNPTNSELASYRIAESIWGNCNYKAGSRINNNANENVNKIIKPINDQSTILSWLAHNTDDDSCTSNRCIDNQEYNVTDAQCMDMCLIETSSLDFNSCTKCNNKNSYLCCAPFRMTGTTKKNCCTESNILNLPGNNKVCCNNTQVNINIGSTESSETKICAPSTNVTVVLKNVPNNTCGADGATLLCFGTLQSFDPANGTYVCNGTYVYRCNNNGKIIAPGYDNTLQGNGGSYHTINYFCYTDNYGTEANIDTSGDCQLSYTSTTN